MQNANLAKNVILKTGFVNEGKITIFPKRIICDLSEFNNKYSTNFSFETTSEEIMEYLRYKFNKTAISDYSHLKHNTKLWFNSLFSNYAVVNDRR